MTSTVVRCNDVRHMNIELPVPNCLANTMCGRVWMFFHKMHLTCTHSNVIVSTVEPGHVAEIVWWLSCHSHNWGGRNLPMIHARLLTCWVAYKLGRPTRLHLKAFSLELKRSLSDLHRHISHTKYVYLRVDIWGLSWRIAGYVLGSLVIIFEPHVHHMVDLVGISHQSRALRMYTTRRCSVTVPTDLTCWLTNNEYQITNLTQA